MKKGETKIKEVIHTILIATAVVFFWRGVWGLADAYLFPDNIILSLWISVLIGIVILIGTENLIKNLI